MSNCLLKKTNQQRMGQCNQFLAKYFITRISLFFFFKCGNKIAILSRWWTEHYCLELLRLHDVLHIFFNVYVIVKELDMTNCELSRLMSSFFFSFKKQTLYNIETSFWFILRSFFEGKVLDITKSSSYISFSVKRRVL